MTSEIIIMNCSNCNSNKLIRYTNKLPPINGVMHTGHLRCVAIFGHVQRRNDNNLRVMKTSKIDKELRDVDATLDIPWVVYRREH